MTIGEGPDTVEVQPPRTLSARQWAFDAAVAAALTLYGIGAALHGSEYVESGPATALLVGVAGAAQALRRHRPTVAFVASAAALATLAVLVAPFQAGSSLLIVLVATYSAMAYAARRAVVVAGAVALVLAESLQDASAARAQAPSSRWCCAWPELPVWWSVACAPSPRRTPRCSSSCSGRPSCARTPRSMTSAVASP